MLSVLADWGLIVPEYIFLLPQGNSVTTRLQGNSLNSLAEAVFVCVCVF